MMVSVLDKMFPPSIYGTSPNGWEHHCSDAPLWLRVASVVPGLREQVRHVWIERGYWWLYPMNDVSDDERDPAPDGWAVRAEEEFETMPEEGWLNYGPVGESPRRMGAMPDRP